MGKDHFNASKSVIKNGCDCPFLEEPCDILIVAHNTIAWLATF
jgi:hypothetical protein